MLFHNEKGRRSHLSHGLIMLLCCLIPVVLISIIPRLNITSGGVRSILPIGVMLLCPLMHVFMMKGMHKGDQRVEAKDENAHKRESCH